MLSNIAISTANENKVGLSDADVNYKKIDLQYNNNNIQEVDILYLYTTKASNAANTNGGVPELVRNGIDSANAAFATSGANVRLNSVGIFYWDDFQESETTMTQAGGGLHTDFLKFENDPNVIFWRDHYGADLVHLIVHNERPLSQCYWGAATRWAGVVQVTRIGAPTYTFTHEVAHNFQPGNANFHELGQQISTNPRQFTLMAKDPANPCATKRVNQFSSTVVTQINSIASSVANYKSTSPCFSSGTLFCDIPEGYWAKPEVEVAYTNSITKGCDSQKTAYDDLPFCPNELLDRAHTSVFILRRYYKGIDDNYDPQRYYNYQGWFEDVPESHAQALWIEDLYRQGLTNGSTNCAGTQLRFCPAEIVTRAELSSFLLRGEQARGRIEDFSDLSHTGIFNDVPESNPHSQAIEYMYINGFTNGCSDFVYGSFFFCPDAQIDRVHAIVFMMRVFGLVEVNTPDPHEYNGVPKALFESRGSDNSAQNSEVLELDQRSPSFVQSHSIVPASDVDWVKFSLRGGRAALLIETGGFSGDTRLWLYDANFNEIYFDDDSGDGRFSKISNSCNSPLSEGTYYLKIDEYENNAEIINYSLTVDVLESCNNVTPTPSRTPTPTNQPPSSRTPTPTPTQSGNPTSSDEEYIYLPMVIR